MGEMKIVKLRFKSAVHLGADIPGVGLESVQTILHSDTLFSSLINSYTELFGIEAANNLITTYLNGIDIPFQISSGFLFYDEQYQTRYLLPKPLSNPPDFYHPKFGNKRKQENNKSVKRIEWINIDKFNKWLCGEEVSTKQFDDDIAEYQIYYSLDVRLQHARDRLTDASTIYYTGLLHFDINAGLYFILELDEKLINWKTMIRILQQAGQNGIGGRRSLGNGVFETELVDLTEDWNKLFSLPAQNSYVSLSLFFPENVNTIKPVSYELIPRKGWTFSLSNFKQMKRKTSMMFREGSIFKDKSIGKIIDVTPEEYSEHKVYRYGMPIFLPFKTLGDNND